MMYNNGVNNKDRGVQSMTVDELVEATGRSRVTIYKVARKLGRMPSVEEILNRKNGRPRKYDY